MTPSLQISLSFALTFGVPSALGVWELLRLRRREPPSGAGSRNPSTLRTRLPARGSYNLSGNWKTPKPNRSPRAIHRL